MAQDEKTNSRVGLGVFFGIILVVWGLAILSDTYLNTDFTQNLFPIFAVILGFYLIFTSFLKV